MIELSSENLAKIGRSTAVPGYDRSALLGGIVHFGVGNFHRVQLAALVDACLHQPGNEAWGIVGVGMTDSPAARVKAESYRAQDCLYTLTEFSPDGVGHSRVIGAMIAYLHAPADPEAVVARLAHPDTRIVSLTITEGGYNIDEARGAFQLEEPDVTADLRGGPPRTVFGAIVEGLARRRAAGLPAFTVMSCDNLRGSGDTARNAIVGFARARDPALADWIEANVDFPNSMVDRLAPQVPDGQRVATNALSGINDRLPAITESFSQWVMEDRFRRGRPPLEDFGVTFSDNVSAYLAVKGRLLNGPHVLLAYPALLMGYRIVADALTNPLLTRLVDTFLRLDATPTVKGPPGLSLEAYAAGFVPRFANPAIADQLLRVAGDGCAKLPTFHGQTIRMLIEQGGDLRREAFLMACFDRYLRFRFDPDISDDREGRFEPFEPGMTQDDWATMESQDPSAVLRIKAMAPFGLENNITFRHCFDQYAAALADRGATKTLQDVLGVDVQ